MPLDLSRIPERLKQAARTGNLVPFIGAGVSRHALRSDSKTFPTWTELIHELMRTAQERYDITTDEFGEMETLLLQGRHSLVAQALKNELGAEFSRVIGERCFPNDAEPVPIHRRLFDLKCPLILTTNYDCLLEDGCLQQTGIRARALTFEDTIEVQSALHSEKDVGIPPLLFKLHGSLQSYNDKIILTTLDYRYLMSREDYRLILALVFIAKVVLMIGFSFSDPDLIGILESVRRFRSGFLVLPAGERGPVEKKYLRDELGIEVIEYESTAGHPELLEFVDYLAEVVRAGRPLPTPGDAATRGTRC